jgi:hypothetical protein
MFRLQVFSLFVLSIISPLPPLVNCHTYMLSPKPRYADLCIPVFDSSTCCAGIPNNFATLPTYSRGQAVYTEWGRNNHVGGFIRYSITEIGNSNNQDSFETFQYNCYASNCVGYSSSIYTGDPGGSGYNTVKCTANVYIPDWLPDGTYTMQWRWHSGGDSYNIRELGLVDFVTCHDFNIKGGELKPKPICPLFVGGDESTPDLNTCEFFKSNDINACTDIHNCYSWFAKAPPKEILECPTNVVNKMRQETRKEPGERLFIGQTLTPNKKPDNIKPLDISTFITQFKQNDQCTL